MQNRRGHKAGARRQWATEWLLIGMLLASTPCPAGVIWGYVQDRGGNLLNGARMEYWRQECGCFPGQCGSGAPIVDYTGPSPYGHMTGQFYTINIPPGRYNVKVTYNGVSYDNALTNIPMASCDNGNVQGPFMITLSIGGATCPYQSLQARVQTSEVDPWEASKTISLGQSVRVASFRDDSGRLTDCCTTMRFSGPGSDTAVSNLQTVTPPQVGTYTLRATCGTRADTAIVNVVDGAPGPNYRFGLNPNDLTDPNRVLAVANHFQNLNAGWVRLEIIPSQPPSYWSWVVDQFVTRGIGVLGLLSNRTWPGEARDPSACAGGDRRYPNIFGERLVRDFLNAADPYVQTLKDRVAYWELWNEATAPPTHLCPENYAYLLVEARLRWPDVGSIGPSSDSQGIGVAARNYLDDLANRTDKALYWQETFGDLPWDFVLHHPYPGGFEPENYIPQQLQMLFDVQWKPIWFTEIGWGGGGDETGQADRLRRAYDTALSHGADVMFWFALYDCVPTFGLIADCANPNGRQRPSYHTYRQAAASWR